MTIICAIHEPGVGTWIGSDTLAVFGGQRKAFGMERKWIVGQRWSVAVSGCARAYDILSEQADWAEEPTAPTAVRAIRAALFADGWVASDEKGQPASADLNLILASAAEVWGVCRYFTMHRSRGLWAGGSGLEYAFGAAHALQRIGETDCERIIRAAIDAACAFDTGCGGEAFVQLLRG